MCRKKCFLTALTVLFPIAQTLAAEAGNNQAAFNPAISLNLSGSYSNLQQDQKTPVTGFAMNPSSVYAPGFNLGESELGIAANIDPSFQGVTTLALIPSGGISVENAFVQTTTLGEGIRIKFGRFFSSMGYLNEHHAHAWDFVDQPLVYAIFWNNQLSEDGAQVKWLAPTDKFIELGMELGKGRGFPGTDTPKNGSGANVLYVHAGDDIGIEQSWRIGTSLHQTNRINALSNNVPDLLATPNGVSNLFSGDSHTVGLDFVWKYAHNGNAQESNWKVQGEYFKRKETGLLTYNLLTTSSFDILQSGWYAQCVHQFRPRWRLGARYDQLDPGVAQIGAANATNLISNFAFQPKRTTVMLDYSPSEFSRLRLQIAQNSSHQNLPDTQFFLQYLMSLGAHGAHSY